MKLILGLEYLHLMVKQYSALRFLSEAILVPEFHSCVHSHSMYDIRCARGWGQAYDLGLVINGKNKHNLPPNQKSFNNEMI